MRSTALKIYKEHIAPNYRLQVDGSIKKIRVRKELPARLRELYDTYSPVMDPTPAYDDFAELFDEFLEDDQESPSEDRGCTDLCVAIEEYIRWADLEVAHDQVRSRASGRLINPETVKSSIAEFCWVKNQEIRGQEGQTPYPKVEMMDKFRNYQSTLIAERWIELQAGLSHVPGNSLKGMAGQILDAIGCAPDTREMDMAMFVHWCWTLKRRFLCHDYRPALPLMLVLSGPQGCGKSSLVETHLTRPFSDKVINTQLDIIYDSREIEKYTGNLVINFDELAKADKKSEQTAELLKNLITMGHTQGRVMYSTSQQKMEILTTFAATTNKHLSEVVRDETGARRYWVLETRGVKNSQFDWDVLENFDWVTFWRTIDENRPRGYFSEKSTIFPKVEAVQNSYCISPIVRDWFDENYCVLSEDIEYLYESTQLELSKLKPSEQPTGFVLLTFGTMYELYVDTMKDRDLYACSPTAFHRMLEKMGVRHVRQSKRYKTPYYVVLKKSELDREEAAE